MALDGKLLAVVQAIAADIKALFSGKLAVTSGGDVEVPGQLVVLGTAIAPNIIRGFSGGFSKPANGQVIDAGIAPYAFTIVAGNCSAKARVAAAVSTVFTLKAGATTLGTITFAAGATSGTVNITNGSVVKSSLLSIECPAQADATLDGINILIRA